MEQGKGNTIYGIDLGTTFSAISFVNSYGDPVCVPLHEEGRWTMPSAVLLVPGGKVYVGEDAIANSWMEGSLLVEFAKRGIGLDKMSWRFEGWEYYPEDISSLILRKIVQQVRSEKHFDPVREVVVSHPQYFWTNQKDATREAAELAGLSLKGTITEPNAAAIAYGVINPSSSGEKVVLVFDLGGGTFDVTLMRIGGHNKFHMIDSNGDSQLGGMNWDAEIVALAKEKFRQSFSDFDTLANEEDKITLRKNAEKTKIKFSKEGQEQHRFFVEADGNKLPFDITREQFVSIGLHLVARCIDRCERLFRKSGYDWSKIDEVLMVGSSTKMPTVQERVTQLFGRAPLISKDPKLMVSKGAAIWADWLSKNLIDARWGDTEEGTIAGLQVADKPEVSGCTAHGLGVIAQRHGRRIVDVLIPQSASTPTEVKKSFVTDTVGATTVVVPVYEGESLDPEDCYKIGDVRLEGLPVRDELMPIMVKFRIDTAGCLDVSAIDVLTGKETATHFDKDFSRDGTDNKRMDFEARRKHLEALTVM